MNTSEQHSTIRTIIGALIVASFLFTVTARAESGPDNLQDLIDIAQTNCGIILNEKVNLTVSSNGELGLVGEEFSNPSLAYNSCMEESVRAIYKSFGIPSTDSK